MYWSLVHLIEAYDFTEGARVYLDVLPAMLPTAREWMKLRAIRQLNHEDARRRHRLLVPGIRLRVDAGS